MDLLYHIAAAQDWAQAQRDGEYRMSTRGRSLAEEGFIHASTAGQVAPVANAFYADDHDLLLLVLDPRRIQPEVRYEQVPGWAEPFPHIYGPLNTSAVLRAVRLERDAAGRFLFPAGADGRHDQP